MKKLDVDRRMDRQWNISVIIFVIVLLVGTVGFCVFLIISIGLSCVLPMILTGAN